MNQSEDQELSVLAGRHASASISPPQKSLLRSLLPWLTLLGLALLIAYVLRDRILSAPNVRVATVVAKPHSASTTAVATVSVQAPGWVEPDPYPTYATALAPGIVEKVLVLEGQRVEAGQVIATLIADDAQLEVDKAQAEIAAQNAALAAAKAHWDNPIALDRAVGIAKTKCAETRAQLVELDAVIAQKAAATAEAKDLDDRLRKGSEGTFAKSAVQQAHFQLLAKQADETAAMKKKAVLAAQLAAHEVDLAAAQQNRKLRIDDEQRLANAKANLAGAKARLQEAQLRLSRMNVRSPADGVVIDLLTAPGAKLMLDMDNPHSAHVAHLYDPEHLQVRVDVPLADAALVGVGQKAQIIVDVLPDKTFNGVVTRFVQEANLSKNTVQAKVTIENPANVLRPQMLARVRFLAETKEGSSETAVGDNLGIWVRSDSIQSESEGAGAVWLLTADGQRVTRREVQLSGQSADGWTVVSAGLNPGDRVVVAPSAELQDNQRVHATEETTGAN